MLASLNAQLSVHGRSAALTFSVSKGRVAFTNSGLHTNGVNLSVVHAYLQGMTDLVDETATVPRGVCALTYTNERYHCSTP